MNLFEPLKRIGDNTQRAAMILAIDNIIAPPAPGIEQPRPLAGLRVKQLGGHGKGFRTERDRIAGVSDQFRSSSYRRDLGRGGVSLLHSLTMPTLGPSRKQEGSHGHKSPAFMAKIVVCGT